MSRWKSKNPATLIQSIILIVVINMVKKIMKIPDLMIWKDCGLLKIQNPQILSMNMNQMNVWIKRVLSSMIGWRWYMLFIWIANDNGS